MKESEYLKATNRVKVSLALYTLRAVLPGDDYGVTANELVRITAPLRKLEEKLFSSYDIQEDNNNE